MNTTVLFLAIIVGAPAAKDPPKEDPGIVGQWIPESTTLAGKTSKSRGQEGTRYEFTKDGKQILRNLETKKETVASTYKVDAKANPATIDITISKPRGGSDTLLGIYKIEGDTLTIVTRAGGGERPKKFEANDGARDMMMTFKRAKGKE